MRQETRLQHNANQERLWAQARQDGNPAYASHSGAHGEKFISLAAQGCKCASIATLTEAGLRANKTLLLCWHIKIHFTNTSGSWGKVVKYNNIKDHQKNTLVTQQFVNSTNYYGSFQN